MHVPQSFSRRLLYRGLRIFFRLLYHEFAWTYDFVANTVSLGRWNDWVKSVQPFMYGNQILELGHGPGHLQAHLFSTGYHPVGVDRSFQMNRLAMRRLHDRKSRAILHASADSLPFPEKVFSTIVSTFPSEYIYEPKSLVEIKRVLIPGGRLIVLPAAWINGDDILSSLAAALFRITGQVPSEAAEAASKYLSQPFEAAGFRTSTEVIEVRSSQVLMIIAAVPQIPSTI